ncbi:UDP-glucuronosyltransferase 1A1-like [Loxodonta africana]|uniref:UDP-glucuronosyltransferase 1A1-like n=1 Tax=Loxodonta africana TaxID=9785 RepID=UPI0030CB4ECE
MPCTMANGLQGLRPLVLGLHPLVLSLLLCVLGPSGSQGGKLLVVPMDGSHWLSMVAVIQQLHQSGHEIVVVAPASSVNIKEGAFYTLKMFPVPFQKEDLEAIFVSLGHDVFENEPFLQRVIKMYKGVKRTSAMLLSTCSHLLHNEDLMASLAARGFEAVLTDPFLPCGSIVAQYLSLPAVYFLNGLPCGLDVDGTQCPSPPSYVPRSLSVNPDHMTFLQRVKNMLITFIQPFLCSAVYSPFASLASKVLRRDVTVQDLMSFGSVWLLRNDFVVNYPRPTMPNIVFIGGINCVTQKPLSQVCI